MNLRSLAAALLLLAILPLSLRQAFATGAVLNYRIPAAAQVSINIYDRQGHVVRQLLQGAPRNAGLNAETWDGLDDMGRPAPVGEYNWKLLSSQGLKATWIMTLGTNPTPAWDTWPGNHGGIYAVAADGANMYVAGAGEGTISLVKQTLGGNRIWCVPSWYEAWISPTALAKDGDTLYLWNPNGHLYAIDDDTGVRKAMLNLTWDGKPEPATHPFSWCSENTDMSVRNGRIAISYYGRNAIRWYNAADGTQIDEAAVPSPLGIAMSADGTVYAISNDTVVTLSTSDKTPRMLISSGLDGAYRIAIDPASGDLFVAEQGAGQQVKRFSSSGRLIRTYGPKGGRPTQGLYDPTGFENITALAADGTGGFIIAETEAPRRTARFAADGKLVRQWIGPQMYASYAGADPDDPTLVWGESQFGSLNEYKVDYAKATWTVRATYTYANLAAGMIAQHSHGEDCWFVRHHDGHTYLCRNNHPVVLEVDEAHRRLIPRAAFLIAWYLRGGAPAIVTEASKKFNLDPTNGGQLLWTDTNGDGIPQLDEFELVSIDPWGGEHGEYVAPDMTYVRTTFQPYDPTVITVIPIDKWLPSGVPHYDYGKGLKHIAPRPAGITSAGGPVVDPAGMIYTIANPIEAETYHGKNKIIKFDPEGNLIWMIGRDASGSEAKPGEVYSFYRPTGYTHGCVVFTDYGHSAIPVWDTDGLWVGRMLDNPDLNAAPASAYVLCSENFGNSIYTNPTTGNVLLFGGAQNNTPVYRITGWDQIRRQSGVVTLATLASAPIPSGAALPGSPSAEADQAVVVPQLTDYKVDASLDKYRGMSPLIVKDGQDVRAKVYLGWTTLGFYAAFDVDTDRPWKSAASIPSLAFQGGAAVDIEMGPVEPARTAPMAGDMRVVASPSQGLVEIDPVLPPGLTAADQSPAKYQTGQGSITVARAAVVVGGKTALYLKPDHKGYIVEMMAPWHSPLDIKSGTTLLFDASVILSDPLGTHSETRLPWHSTDQGDLTTQDTYLESLLRPGNWGRIVLR